MAPRASLSENGSCAKALLGMSVQLVQETLTVDCAVRRLSFSREIYLNANETKTLYILRSVDLLAQRPSSDSSHIVRKHKARCLQFKKYIETVFSVQNLGAIDIPFSLTPSHIKIAKGSTACGTRSLICPAGLAGLWGDRHHFTCHQVLH